MRETDHIKHGEDAENAFVARGEFVCGNFVDEHHDAETEWPSAVVVYSNDTLMFESDPRRYVGTDL
jgi:hypothetical protein